MESISWSKVPRTFRFIFVVGVTNSRPTVFLRGLIGLCYLSNTLAMEVLAKQGFKKLLMYLSELSSFNKSTDMHSECPFIEPIGDDAYTSWFRI